VNVERGFLEIGRMKLRQGAQALPERPEHSKEGDLFVC
jgi:hypothetical protein